MTTTYLYVGPTAFDAVIHNDSPTPEVMSVRTLQEMFTAVGDKRVTDLALMIDVTHLPTLKCLGMFEVAKAVSTMVDSHRLMHGQRMLTVPCGISMSVRSDTPTADLKEIVSANTHCICPIGENISLYEQQMAATKWFERSDYIPHYVKTKVCTVKHTKGETTTLTPRQAQMLHIIVTRGCDNKTIAKLTGLSVGTVKLHIGALYKKYGVRTRSQLLVAAKNDL